MGERERSGFGGVMVGVVVLGEDDVEEAEAG